MQLIGSFVSSQHIPTSAAIFVNNGAFDIARLVRNVSGCTLCTLSLNNYCVMEVFSCIHRCSDETTSFEKEQSIAIFTYLKLSIQHIYNSF